MPSPSSQCTYITASYDFVTFFGENIGSCVVTQKYLQSLLPGILIRIGETGAIAGGINDFIKCHGVVPYRGV